MKRTVLRILGLLILIGNAGFSEYIIENSKIYYNEDYHKTLVVKRIDDEKSEKYLVKIIIKIEIMFIVMTKC